MARKVVCRCCGKKIPLSDAVKTPHGRVSWYYCQEHVGEKSPQEKLYDIIYEVFGHKTVNTALFKELNEINSVHSHKKVISYIEENRQYLEQAMQKEFYNEYGKIRYFSTILKNNLGNYQMKASAPVVKKEIEADVGVTTKKYKAKKQRRGMDDLLNDLL